MEIFNNIKDTSEKIKEWKQKGFSIGFVPTMGYLHEGHKSLIDKSVSENGKTAVSIFVNPTQFSPTEDLDKYPRDFEADRVLCETSGVDLIFYPDVSEMYPAEFNTFVEVEGVTNGLCGKSRPSHFRGVCTVVNKLFNIIKPDRAYFGQKDAQQLAVIKRMTTDLNMDIDIVSCPITREADGLAKSSRNVYLSPEERKAALILSKAIFAGERFVSEGEKNALIIIEYMKNMILSEPLIKIDYLEAVDSITIENVGEISDGVLVAAAVYIGKTRLIDNFIYNTK